jgi:hypothetical protein
MEFFIICYNAYHAQLRPNTQAVVSGSVTQKSHWVTLSWSIELLVGLVSWLVGQEIYLNFFDSKARNPRPNDASIDLNEIFLQVSRDNSGCEALSYIC